MGIHNKTICRQDNGGFEDVEMGELWCVFILIIYDLFYIHKLVFLNVT